MGIDYNAIRRRLDAKKEFAEILSSQVHPWELGYSSKSHRIDDFDRISELHKLTGMRDSLQVFISHPIPWYDINPVVLYTRLVRGEMSLEKVRLHGKLCVKCEGLREMRRRGRSLILPEESTQEPEEPRLLGP